MQAIEEQLYVAAEWCKAWTGFILILPRTRVQDRGGGWGESGPRPRMFNTEIKIKNWKSALTLTLKVKFLSKISPFHCEYSTSVVSKVWGAPGDGVQGILKELNSKTVISRSVKDRLFNFDL
jgi:hypothetical protein